MTVWLVVLAAAAASYLLRISMVVVLGTRALPARLEHHLTFLGPSVLAAIVANSLFVRHGSPSLPAAPTAVGVLVAAAVVARTRRATQALLVGLPAAALAALLLPH